MATKKTRIMYIEYKGEDVTGPARIGRVTFSKTERSLYYRGRTFHKTGGAFGKANYISETGEEYWISGCKKNGRDRLYSGTIEIDDDVREEYWRDIRKMPEMLEKRRIRATGKY
jgi:hypothetical protein